MKARNNIGLIGHSDYKSQYASKACRILLRTHGLIGSMRRLGECGYNTVAENFFGSLKQERVQWRNYQTCYEAQQNILRYISMFCDSHRLRS